MSKELGPETQRHLVIPDLHGEADLGKRAVALAHDLDASPVFLGDLIGRGGPAVRETIELARSEGTAIKGNHELLFLNTLLAIKKGAKLTPKAVKSFREMAGSYGVDSDAGLKDSCTELKQAMDEDGHLEWLEGLEPFFESDAFIAIHAGPRLDQPWSRQRDKIKKQAKTTKDIAAGPVQITDHDHALSGAVAVPETVDKRIFVTGHWHKGEPASMRTADRRIYLTSRLGKDPLFVWDSQEGRILEIPAESPPRIVVPANLTNSTLAA